MSNLKKLPVGIQSFETIRENNYLYVDKTRHIFNMIDRGMFYFLARPRRFGKSLLVSTLKCLFQARKELFEGLWIADHGKWEWKEHPVICIDFNQIPHNTPQNLEHGITLELKKIAAKHKTPVDAPFIETQFQELISGLNHKTGKTVVILIDEYDKPLIDHIGKGEEFLKIAKLNRDILKRLFGVLKGVSVSPMLCFVFFTGVSKFSRISIFSELNNLDDISMNRNYAEMLGYTKDELKTCFKDHIQRFSKETKESFEQIVLQLEQRYDGYRFSEKDVKVFNPFSVLKALNNLDFQNYWFETGTPTFLVNILKQNNYYLPEMEKLEITQSVFSTYDIENLKPEALLFQTGYLTILDVKNRLYTLGYPNQEVKSAFLEILLGSITQGISASINSKFILLSPYLYNEDFNAFFETIGSIFASIPYSIETKRDEAYFHTLFYLMVSASGIDAQSEVLTCEGRIDLVVKFPNKIFIIEFKCNQSAKAGIKQIRDKDYAKPYAQSGKKVSLMGINFSTEKRNVDGWEINTVSS